MACAEAGEAVERKHGHSTRHARWLRTVHPLAMPQRLGTRGAASLPLRDGVVIPRLRGLFDGVLRLVLSTVSNTNR